MQISAMVKKVTDGRKVAIVNGMLYGCKILSGVRIVHFHSDHLDEILVDGQLAVATLLPSNYLKSNLSKQWKF